MAHDNGRPELASVAITADGRRVLVPFGETQARDARLATLRRILHRLLAALAGGSGGERAGGSP